MLTEGTPVTTIANTLSLNVIEFPKKNYFFTAYTTGLLSHKHPGIGNNSVYRI